MKIPTNKGLLSMPPSSQPANPTHGGTAVSQPLHTIKNMNLLTVKDFDKNLLLEIGQILLKNTVQLFKNKSEKGIGGLGSGILFEFEDNYFIITASHNFIHSGEFVGHGIDDFSVQVGQYLYDLKREIIFGIDEPSYERTKIDLAIVKLKSSNLIDDLKKHKSFLALSNINFFPNQRIINEANNEPSDYYILFGFPETKTKKVIKSYNPTIEDRKFNITAYCQMEYLRNKIPQRLIKEGFTNHIFFNKIKKGSDLNFENRLIKPVQNGMSGCGLWEINVDLIEGKPQLKLAGIFTEFQKGFGISVKLKFAIALIQQMFNLERLPKFR
ncbi:MAG: hypothetical protein IPN76_05930 [Saprospiraceae bacterium]|nr:hypothetical protein [Saprospiraceae bacterium]